MKIHFYYIAKNMMIFDPPRYETGEVMISNARILPYTDRISTYNTAVHDVDIIDNQTCFGMADVAGFCDDLELTPSSFMPLKSALFYHSHSYSEEILSRILWKTSAERIDRIWVASYRVLESNTIYY